MTVRRQLEERLCKAFRANKIPVTPDVEEKLNALPEETLLKLAEHWEARSAGFATEDEINLLDPKTPTKTIITIIRRMSGFRYGRSKAGNAILRQEHQWHGSRPLNHD